jgi:hypothetical protein
LLTRRAVNEEQLAQLAIVQRILVAIPRESANLPDLLLTQYATKHIAKYASHYTVAKFATHGTAVYAAHHTAEYGRLTALSKRKLEITDNMLSTTDQT